MKKSTFSYFENVLLIDDEEIDNLINERLIQANYFAKNVQVKTNIPSAIEYLYKTLEAGENIPEMIFLDLHLPQYDGFHFILEYKQMQYKYAELNNTNIVILSAFVEKYPEHLLTTNTFVVDVVSKPLGKEALESIKEKLEASTVLSA